MQAAAQVCDARYGVIENGAITPASYKRCMLKQNWKYQSTARVKTYIDPNSGMSCHDEGGGAVCVRRKAPSDISIPIRIPVHPNRAGVGVLQFSVAFTAGRSA